MARSSVLLPDMFDPLTTSSRRGRSQRDAVPHAALFGQQRMAHVFAFEQRRRRLRCELGKRVVRMLPRVIRERRKSFDLRSPLPATQRPADRSPPATLRSPCRSGWSRAAAGRGRAGGRCRANREAPSGGEGARFDARLAARPHQWTYGVWRAAENEIFGFRGWPECGTAGRGRARALRRSERYREFSCAGKREQSFDNADGDHAKARIEPDEVGGDPPESASPAMIRENISASIRCHDGKGRGGVTDHCTSCAGLTPLRKSSPSTASCSRRSSRGRSSLTASCRAISSAGCGAVPDADFSHAARRSSPPRVRAVDQQLEQAGAAEQIQIGGAGMVRIGKPRAVFAAALPSVFEPSDPAFIEANSRAGPVRRPARFVTATRRAR